MDSWSPSQSYDGFEIEPSGDRCPPGETNGNTTLATFLQLRHRQPVDERLGDGHSDGVYVRRPRANADGE